MLVWDDTALETYFVPWLGCHLFIKAGETLRPNMICKKRKNHFPKSQQNNKLSYLHCCSWVVLLGPWRNCPEFLLIKFSVQYIKDGTLYHSHWRSQQLEWPVERKYWLQVSRRQTCPPLSGWCSWSLPNIIIFIYSFLLFWSYLACRCLVKWASLKLIEQNL